MAAKRLLVSIDDNIFQKIEQLAAINHLSLSKIASKLIITSLELEEDKIYSEMAEDRITTTKQWFSHEDAWK